jgi:membrane-associated phospholipid phosphatase
MAIAVTDRRPSRREWGTLLAYITLVPGIELSDDAAHALFAPSNQHRGLVDAATVIHFEENHDLWLEPALQQFSQGVHHLLGLPFGWSQIAELANTVYGLGHVFVTLAFALWIFFRRRTIFPVVGRIFLLTNLLAVVIYELYPLAPPRLAGSVSFDGRPYHFIDTVFGSGGLQIGFNEYASMPSVHVAWALIVGLTLCATLHHPLARLLALLWPATMAATVIVTGNHYVLDVLGAAAVVAMASLLTLLSYYWKDLARTWRSAWPTPPTGLSTPGRHHVAPHARRHAGMPSA